MKKIKVLVSGSISHLPDDLFKHNIGIDFVKLNYKPLLLNHNCMNGYNPN